MKKTNDQRDQQQLSIMPPEYCAEEEANLLPQSMSSLDKVFKAQLARLTLSITPAGLSADIYDWLMHLGMSPEKQYELCLSSQRRYLRFLSYLASSSTGQTIEPSCRPLTDDDDRFDDVAWQRWPYNVIHQSFLMMQEFWTEALNDIDGLPREKEKALSFVVRQILDRFSPSNFVSTNPIVTRRTIEQGGLNLLEGWKNTIEDWHRFVEGRLPVGADDYVKGRDVATSEGKVIYRNHLMELIQYTPQTGKVHAEPVLIVPAWIMKYYILDLSPDNSFVRYLVQQGYTVFMISWRNPTAEDRDLGLNDYINLGVRDALTAVMEIVPNVKVHTIGYCIGGTLLMMAAAAMAREKDNRIKTITLFAAETDFTEAGEIMLFVSESQVDYLESLMWEQGYLDSHQMAGAFQMLQSNDLIWSRYIQEYLLGHRQEMFDLMAWNADTTRMPYKMHSEYLRKLFLENQLAQGKFEVDGEPVSITDINQSIFCVSTIRDHVAPWHSVYKIHLLADTDITFVLANRGHNAGIVSEPGHQGRKYKILTQKEQDNFIPPVQWREKAKDMDGSWWPALNDWLASHSTQMVDPPVMAGKSGAYTQIVDAPGTYVFQD